MPLTSGINHVTVPTPDLDRLAGFYAPMFEAPTVFQVPATAPAWRSSSWAGTGT